jgi:hypothetical protein
LIITRDYDDIATMDQDAYFDDEEAEFHRNTYSIYTGIEDY